jgi:hypothetical protein
MIAAVRCRVSGSAGGWGSPHSATEWRSTIKSARAATQVPAGGWRLLRERRISRQGIPGHGPSGQRPRFQASHRPVPPFSKVVPTIFDNNRPQTLGPGRARQPFWPLPAGNAGRLDRKVRRESVCALPGRAFAEIFLRQLARAPQLLACEYQSQNHGQGRRLPRRAVQRVECSLHQWRSWWKRGMIIPSIELVPG